MSDRLAGKVAFITGVARGQGRAHAVRLASEGADIIGVDICAPVDEAVPYDPASEDELAETARLVEEQGRHAKLSVVDVRDHAAVQAAVDAGVSELGGLDIVVANAGICIPQAWDTITPEVFAAVLDTNVTGVWNTVMACAPRLVEQGSGSIVITSSYAGKKVQPFMVHYTTSKHAVTGMTRAFAAELGRHGVRVNSVHPGGVATGMTTGNMMEAMMTAGATNEKLNAMGTPFMEQMYAEPEEIANVVAFLASDEAKWITAEHISVDGGAQYF